MFTIRKISDNEFEKASALIQLTIKTCYPAIYAEEVINFFLNYHTPQEIKNRATEGIFLILEDENELRGTGFIVKDELGGVYVHPDYQHKGYGRAMVQKLLDFAAGQKCSYIHLDSTPLAKSLYLCMGFELVGPAVEWVGDTPLHYFKMEKYL